MFTYEQRTGILQHNGETIGTGYSGHDCPPDAMGKNNPELQDVHDVGPIPQGKWAIGDLFDDPETGPFSMRLTPENGTDTFGRSAFLIHGDSIADPGGASHGCIIMPRAVRLAIGASGDKELQVVSG